MAVTVNNIFKLIRVAKKAKLPSIYFPELEKGDAAASRAGLMLRCDSYDGAIIVHTGDVESELLCPNPSTKNIGGFLWKAGYEIYPVRVGRKIVFQVKFGKFKKQYQKLVDAGIAALKHYHSKGGYENEKEKAKF